MKKILLTTLLLAPVAAFAQTSTTTSTSTPVVTGTTTPATTTQVICIQNSLDKRENALIAGHDVFNTAIKTALQKRLSGLKEAYAQTDKKTRQEKRQLVWKTFKTDTQAAHTAVKTVRQGAWKTFDTDMKACGVRGHGEAPHTVAMPAISL
jgi:hypothetical protein